MGEDRQYPPSDLKIAQLRREGIVPKSRELGSAAALMGAVLALALVAPAQIDPLLLWLEHSWSSALGAPKNGTALSFAVASAYFTAISFFLIPLLIVVLIAGFLQTRFLFSLAILRFDGSRLTSGLSRFFPELAPRFLRSLVGIALLVLYAFVLSMVFRYALERDRAASAVAERAQLTTLLKSELGGVTRAVARATGNGKQGDERSSKQEGSKNAGKASPPISSRAPGSDSAPANAGAESSPLASPLPGSQGMQVIAGGPVIRIGGPLLRSAIAPWWDLAVQGLRACAAFFLFIGLLARLVAGIEFRRRHRMSREEVEQEARENEGSPELKRLIRDLQS